MGSMFSADMLAAAPLIIISAGSLVMLLLEVTLKDDWPRAGISALFLLLALYLISLGAFPGGRVLGGFLYADGAAVFFAVLIITAALAVLCLAHKRIGAEGVEAHGEYYSLLLAAVAGALVFANSAELITLFLGLELMSLPLYCLVGLALGVRRSVEGSLKYFLLGSFSSAFMLYGIALVYGLTGTTFIPEIAARAALAQSELIYMALGLLAVGLFFKLALVPFHFWCPDAYQGAPTTITAFMASVVKVAAIGAALRIFWSGFGQFSNLWIGLVWIVALLSMTAGNFSALRQRSLKRMLAYSSVAHAGYIMIGFLAPDAFGGAAVLFYAVMYALMTLGAFAVVSVVSAADPADPDVDAIERFNGLASSQPLLAALMALFMFALAGLPPGLAGLLGKFYLFNAGVKNGYLGLIIVALLNSAVSCYYYLRVMVAMYFRSPDGRRPETYEVPLLVHAVLFFCAFGVVFFGAFPSLIYEPLLAIMQSFKVS